MYDVGQRVSTPKGEAIVIDQSWHSVRVITDLGTFPISEVSPLLDVEAITRSVESLEAWLDESVNALDVLDRRIVGESRLCGCPCGKAGHCHRLVHVDVIAEVDVKVFPHSIITTECRCLVKDCACTH